MTICDSCNKAVKPTANYCPECGTELKPTLKDWSDGFLSLVDRGHIQEAIDGNEVLPERYRERLQEVVRHALADFCLLNRWDEFDNTEALFGDLPDGDIDLDDPEQIEKLVRLTCPIRFMLNATEVEQYETILEMSIYLKMQDSGVEWDDVSVR